jgi:hypothetical protein
VLAANTIDIGGGDTKAAGTLKFLSQTSGSPGSVVITDEARGTTAEINIGTNVEAVDASGHANRYARFARSQF